MVEAQWRSPTQDVVSSLIFLDTLFTSDRRFFGRALGRYWEILDDSPEWAPRMLASYWSSEEVSPSISLATLGALIDSRGMVADRRFGDMDVIWSRRWRSLIEICDGSDIADLAAFGGEGSQRALGKMLFDGAPADDVWARALTEIPESHWASGFMALQRGPAANLANLSGALAASVGSGFQPLIDRTAAALRNEAKSHHGVVPSANTARRPQLMWLAGVPRHSLLSHRLAVFVDRSSDRSTLTIVGHGPIQICGRVTSTSELLADSLLDPNPLIRYGLTRIEVVGGEDEVAALTESDRRMLVRQAERLIDQRASERAKVALRQLIRSDLGSRAIDGFPEPLDEALRNLKDLAAGGAPVDIVTSHEARRLEGDGVETDPDTPRLSIEELPESVSVVPLRTERGLFRLRVPKASIGWNVFLEIQHEFAAQALRNRIVELDRRVRIFEGWLGRDCDAIGRHLRMNASDRATFSATLKGTRNYAAASVNEGTERIVDYDEALGNSCELAVYSAIWLARERRRREVALRASDAMDWQIGYALDALVRGGNIPDASEPMRRRISEWIRDWRSIVRALLTEAAKEAGIDNLDLIERNMVLHVEGVGEDELELSLIEVVGEYRNVEGRLSRTSSASASPAARLEAEHLNRWRTAEGITQEFATCSIGTSGGPFFDELVRKALGSQGPMVLDKAAYLAERTALLRPNDDASVALDLVRFAYNESRLKDPTALATFADYLVEVGFDTNRSGLAAGGLCLIDFMLRRESAEHEAGPPLSGLAQLASESPSEEDSWQRYDIEARLAGMMIDDIPLYFETQSTNTFPLRARLQYLDRLVRGNGGRGLGIETLKRGLDPSEIVPGFGDLFDDTNRRSPIEVLVELADSSNSIDEGWRSLEAGRILFHAGVNTLEYDGVMAESVVDAPFAALAELGFVADGLLLASTSKGVGAPPSSVISMHPTDPTSNPAIALSAMHAVFIERSVEHFMRANRLMDYTPHTRRSLAVAQMFLGNSRAAADVILGPRLDQSSRTSEGVRPHEGAALHASDRPSGRPLAPFRSGPGRAMFELALWRLGAPNALWIDDFRMGSRDPSWLSSPVLTSTGSHAADFLCQH